MTPPTPLKKLEVWLTDETNLPYRYAHVRNEGKKMSFDVAQKALELFVTSDSTLKDAPLQVDFVGGEPSNEADTVKNLQEIRTYLGTRRNAPVNFRLITAGLLDDDTIGHLQNNNVVLRDNLSPVDVSDTWWFEAEEDQIKHSATITSIIPRVKKHFRSFHHRLPVSRYTPEIIDRVKKTLSDGASSVFLFPRLQRECDAKDAVDLKETMRELAEWFKGEIVKGTMPSVLNARQLLYMIHRFNQSEPVPIKNRCNNTDERLFLDVDGTMRTCRHFHVHPAWTLGNIQQGFFDPRRMELHKYGLLMRQGCKTCNARFFCAGPCISTATIYMDKYTYPLGYFCLFTKLLTEMIEYVYNTLKFEHPDQLEKAIKQLSSQFQQ